jgi:peptidoglycan/LPS O-acetylase OafA/YrhL
MKSTPYRPEIDGLRAIAIIPVVLFHLGFNWIPGGYMGVDVFFVISGYLITTIILTKRESNSFSFTHFWFRRISRIFPALATMLIVMTLAGLFVFYGQDLKRLGYQSLSAILSFSNITMWRTAGNYWGTDANNSIFLHTWSLSVEEQFYLIYPILIILLLNYFNKKTICILAIMAVCSFSLYLFGHWRYPFATFYLLPTRAWELASGCLIAAMLFKNQFKVTNTTSNILQFLGFFLLLYIYFFYSKERLFYCELLFPVIGAILIILFCVNRNSLIYNLLSSSPFVFIGLISYSLYLWHWPIIVFINQIEFMYGISISIFITIFLIAIFSLASYYIVEKQTRYMTKMTIPVFGVLSFCVILSVYLFLVKHDFDASLYSKPLWKGRLYSVNPVDIESNDGNVIMKGVEEPIRDSKLLEAFASGGIVNKYDEHTPNILVLGDSHAIMWSGIIDSICKELKTSVSFYGCNATPPFIQLPLSESESTLYFTSKQKFEFDKKRLEYILAWKPRIVIIVAKWSTYNNIKVMDDLIKYIGDVGSRVLLIEQPPIFFFGNKSMLEYLAFNKIYPIGMQKQYVRILKNPDYEIGRKLIRELREKYSFCEVIEVKESFVDDPSTALALEGTHVLYIDDDHLSEDGALKIKPKLMETMSKLLSSAQIKN